MSLYIYIYIILPYFKNYIKMNIYTEKYFNSDIELLVIIIFIFFPKTLIFISQMFTCHNYIE